MPKGTDKNPALRIAELEGDVAELKEFHKNNREQLARYKEILATIVAEHQPRIVDARDGVTVELRCRRCQTDEHHTWATDNYVMWPCPTLAPFVSYAVYERPEVAEEVTE